MMSRLGRFGPRSSSGVGTCGEYGTQCGHMWRIWPTVWAHVKNMAHSVGTCGEYGHVLMMI